ncbi:MAG: hypothetical protein SVZ03_09595 [Spirochaetota bacterium]|nr:hypothetical protein [Spirochaetota bacterium]
MDKPKKLAVMFSGGTDSTYAAWTQIPKFDEIHLIIFVRHGLRNPDNPQVMVDRLRKAFPDKNIIFRNDLDFEDIYQKINPQSEKEEVHQLVLNQKINPLWEDPHGKRLGREVYDSNKIKLFMANECLQCKIAMHIAAIQYCIDNEITDICDGGNPEQLDDGSQQEDVKEVAREIFSRYGINYFSPVYNVTPEERCKALYEGGITDHKEHKKLEKNHQIPATQVQCTVPSSVLWTICIFPWLVYDGQSCNEYLDMCYNYYKHEMEEGLKTINLKPKDSKFH